MKFYYRVYDGTNQLLVSTRSVAFAKAVLCSANPSKGPHFIFVGGYAEDVVPFLPADRSYRSV